MDRFDKWIFLRLLAFLILWLILVVVSVTLLTPEPASFSLKTGQFQCESMVDCVKKAKENTKKEWENRKQSLDFIERWNQFIGFSILPLRYEIHLENLSYSQLETTGPMGEKRQFPTKVVCAEEPFIEIWSHSPIKIAYNLELKNVYSAMDELLNKFDGCYFDLSYANWAINNSLTNNRLVVGPNEYVKISEEREFTFPIRLDDMSRAFIAVQLIVLLSLFIAGSKPIIKFVTKGGIYFLE